MKHPEDPQGTSKCRSHSLTARVNVRHGLPWSGVILAIGLATLACYASLGEPDSQASSAQSGTEQAQDKSPRQAIDTFVALAQQRKIDKMVLHYRRWERMTPAPISEEALTHDADLEITYRGPMIDRPVLTLAKTLASPHWQVRTSHTDEHVDFGLAITCYSNDKKVIEASISKRPRILSVNEQRFKLPPELIYSLMPFLPGMVYEGMFIHIITDWAPGPWAPGPWQLNEQPQPLLDLFMPHRTKQDFEEELRWQAEDHLKDLKERSPQP